MHDTDRAGYEVTSELGKWIKNEGAMKEIISDCAKYPEDNKIGLLWERGQDEGYCFRCPGQRSISGIERFELGVE